MNLPANGDSMSVVIGGLDPASHQASTTTGDKMIATPDETCPSRGVIFTQNIQGLSRKDKGLESLMDPLVEIMIFNRIMTYCVQETWILGNSSTMVRDHMVFMHNMNEKEPDSKGRVKRGVAIILSPVVVDACQEAGSKPPITTLMESPFAGRFI